MTATQTAPAAPAAYRRRTSTYVLAFRTECPDWTPADLTDELVAAARTLGYTVHGSHVAGRDSCLVLRFPSDEAAVDAAYDLSADVLAPITGIVTGLGVHRRSVTL